MSSWMSLVLGERMPASCLLPEKRQFHKKLNFASLVIGSDILLHLQYSRVYIMLDASLRCLRKIHIAQVSWSALKWSSIQSRYFGTRNRVLAYFYSRARMTCMVGYYFWGLQYLSNDEPLHEFRRCWWGRRWNSRGCENFSMTMRRCLREILALFVFRPTVLENALKHMGLWYAIYEDRIWSHLRGAERPYVNRA